MYWKSEFSTEIDDNREQKIEIVAKAKLRAGRAALGFIISDMHINIHVAFERKDGAQMAEQRSDNGIRGWDHDWQAYRRIFECSCAAKHET